MRCLKSCETAGVNQPEEEEGTNQTNKHIACPSIHPSLHSVRATHSCSIWFKLLMLAGRLPDKLLLDSHLACGMKVSGGVKRRGEEEREEDRRIRGAEKERDKYWRKHTYKDLNRDTE